jgi:hypothetical protein
MGALSKVERHDLVSAYKNIGCYAQVARKFNVDRRTVRRWVCRREETGALDVKAGAGRPSKLSVAAARKAGELLLSNKFDNCHQVAAELHNLGLVASVVHPTTVSRHAKAQAAADGAPVVAKSGKPDKALSLDNINKRLLFCKANKRTSWATVMITDRKKFRFSYPGTSVKRVQWLRRGERRVANRPNNPQVVNMYAGITKYGVTKAHIVTGTSAFKSSFLNKKGQPSRNITSAEYEVVLKRTLLPEGQRIFSANGHNSWTLQQDNDPTHKKAAHKALLEWNSGKKGKVQLLQSWPPNSPDLSPIENAWAIVQAKVDAAGCKSFADFKETLSKEWNGLSHKHVKALMNSIPARLVACVDEGGRKTRF